MSLPVFSYGLTVSPENAKQDKMEIGIEDGVFFGDAVEAERFLHLLGSPPEDQRDGPDLGPHGFFFGRPDVRPSFLTQAIRRNKLTVGSQEFPAPLLSGNLELRRFQENAWRMKVQTSLNPTRFLRHQKLPPIIHPFRAPPSFEVSLFKRTISQRDEEEFPLCGGDNWILGSHLQHVASDAAWPGQVRKFIRASTEAVVSDLNRAAGMVDTSQLVGPWKYNLHQVETYWEFASLTPLGTVLALEPMLRTFSRRPVRTRDYPCTVTVEEMENSRCLRLQTRAGEILKIYAKTNHRIRFEVFHHLSGDRGFRIPGDRHTFGNIQGVFPLLQSLASIAAQRVNEVLRHFRRNAGTPEHQFAALDLMLKVQEACGSIEAAHGLLDILVNNNSIIVEKGNAITCVFGNALRCLLRKGVFQNSHGRYSVTPPYREALSSMRQGGLGFLLASRRRLRTA